jgi:transposase
VAKVAMSHGINTNIVHGWRKLGREVAAAVAVPQRDFVAVALEPAPAPPAAQRGIEVELRRGAVTMKVIWPPSATAEFAAWTRELLRWSASMPCGWRWCHWTCAPARNRHWHESSVSSVPPDRITPICLPTDAPTA